jgi:hypothetical protein
MLPSPLSYRVKRTRVTTALWGRLALQMKYAPTVPE